MEYLTTCPVCYSNNLDVLYRHQFEAKGVVGQKKLSQNATYLQERLWIFFNKIRKEQSTCSVDSTICQNCGFIFSNARLSEEDVMIKYEAIAELGLDKKRHKRKSNKGIKPRSERVYSLINKVLPNKNNAEPLAILDYGGAEGYLLKPFLNQGHKCYLLDYMQYDLVDERIQYLGRSITDLDEGVKFDLIFFLHTLEHVANPVELVIELKKRLKPGGFLYVEVPLGAWLEWMQMEEPITHLNFFSEQSLYHVLEKAGLKIIFLNSQWQWITNARNLCINIIGKNESGTSSIKPKTTQEQMEQLRYFPKALTINPRYYLKWLVKGVLKRKIKS